MKIKYLYHFILILIMILFLSGCASKIPTHKQRVQTAMNIVSSTNNQKIYTSTYFNHFTYSTLSNGCKTKPTNIYIEGDGLAWLTSSKISNDPTPVNPIALKLFMEDDSQCKVYIARPCQYTTSKNCTNKYWTSDRFSKKVIKSHHKILNLIKKEYRLNQFNIIGYSGGGAIATILAAKRNDIHKLITVAGTLNTTFWTSKHKITALYGSINPVDFSKKLEKIKQYHFIGENDTIIDKSIFQSYIKKFNHKEKIQFKVIKNFTHSYGWKQEWKKLIKLALHE